MTIGQWTGRGVKLAVLISLLGLGACGGVSSALGLKKNTPDEFAIVTQAPLVLPPDFNLRPPLAGSKGAAQTDAEVIASRALIGDPNAVTPGMTPGERTLVGEAGAQHADPLIRQVVDQEYADITRRSEQFSNRLIFGDKATVPDKPIDARVEAERLSKEEGVATGGPPAQKPATIKKDDGSFGDLF